MRSRVGTIVLVAALVGAGAIWKVVVSGDRVGEDAVPVQLKVRPPTTRLKQPARRLPRVQRGSATRREESFSKPAAQDAFATESGGTEPGTGSEALDSIIQWFPELKHDIEAYRADVRDAQTLVADYEAQVKAASEATVRGDGWRVSADAVADRREEILARAKALGQRAMGLNRAIRLAAGVPNE